MPYDERRLSYRDARVAGEYDRRRFASALGRRKHAHDAARVARALRGLPPGARVLDVPAGTGRLAGALAAAGWRPLGADLSVEMLRAGEPWTSGAARLAADVERLPLRDGAVAAVVCLRFFFHVDRPAARERILRELARVARDVVVIEERGRGTAKHAGRRLRGRLGLGRPARPAPGLDDLRGELERAGLTLERALPVSRLFSDKLLLVARPRGPA